MHGCGRGPIDLKSIHCALGRWSALGKLALLAKEQSHGDLGGVIRAVGTRSGVCTALVHVFRPCTHPQNSAAHCDRPSTFLVLGAWSWWGWKHTTEQRVPSNPFLPCAKLSMRSIARRCGSAVVVSGLMRAGKRVRQSNGGPQRRGEVLHSRRIRGGAWLAN